MNKKQNICMSVTPTLQGYIEENKGKHFNIF